MGCILIRHGGKHDWYHNPITKVSQPVPRHREIKEYLAKHIIKILTGKFHINIEYFQQVKFGNVPEKTDIIFKKQKVIKS